jgi:hypothetical protein
LEERRGKSRSLHHRVRGKEVVVELLLFDENAGEEVVW